MMEIGMGVLGWSPDTFWAATMPELAAGLDGAIEKAGGKRDAPMTRAELDDLMREFPD